MGIYISIPFCRTKCSFCNFASGVFSPAVFDRYVQQVCYDLQSAEAIAKGLGAVFERSVDSIYLGGGTPSVLSPEQLQRVFRTAREVFDVDPAAEITVECAPGTLGDQVVAALLRCGVNRVSLGVQSFVDMESSSVGRLHSRAVILDDIARLRSAGIGNISIDLIAGLPHQTEDSWTFSLSETLATGVPHVSVYMLEVDEDSRLGHELLAGGSRYHAHFVPDDDLTADLYLAACEKLEMGGVRQYEISNFARPVTHGMGLRDSQHNSKYWRRRPYFGVGVDAHSMLPASAQNSEVEAVRFSAPDSLELFSATGVNVETRIDQLKASRTPVDRRAALEESFFLGLRLTGGIALGTLRNQFGGSAVDAYHLTIEELCQAGLLEKSADYLRLTPHGRLLSNEVFARFLGETTTGGAT